MNSNYIVAVILFLLLIVSGFFYYRAYQENKELKMQTLELNQEIYDLREQLKEIEEIADWKTYTNEKYGYKVQYPEDWYFLKDACCPAPPAFVSLNNYSEKKIDFSEHQLDEGVVNFDILCTYDNDLDEIGEVELYKKEGLEHEELKINEADSIKFTKENPDGSKVISYYIVGSNSGCRIVFSDECLLCEQILSTFRFTE